MAGFVNKGRLLRRMRVIGAQARDEVARALLRGGLKIEADAVVSIQEQTPGGRPYPSRGRKGAIHWASPEGSAPNADTGELHTGITSTRKETAKGITVEVGANSPYAAALELGRSDGSMAPRPFMSPAFNANVDQIEANVRAAVRRANRK